VPIHQEYEAMQFEAVTAYVVEDDPHRLMVISALLRDLGITFKRNTTGNAVATSVYAMATPPTVIFLSLEMAGAIRVCFELSSLPGFEHVPIIAMGNPCHSDKEGVLWKAGFAAFVPVPIPSRALGSVIKRVINGEREITLPVNSYS
jgi:CheY-like chemotaxis protein